MKHNYKNIKVIVTLLSLGTASLSALDNCVNVGTGAGVYQTNDTTNLYFRTLVGDGGALNVTQGTNSITVSTTAEANTASSAGGQVALTLTKSGTNLPFRGLTAGNYATLNASASDVTIDVAAVDTVLSTSFNSFSASSINVALTNIDKLVILAMPSFSGSLTANVSSLVAWTTIPLSLMPPQEINSFVVINIAGSYYTGLFNISASGVLTINFGVSPINFASGTSISVYPFTICWSL